MASAAWRADCRQIRWQRSAVQKSGKRSLSVEAFFVIAVNIEHDNSGSRARGDCKRRVWPFPKPCLDRFGIGAGCLETMLNQRLLIYRAARKNGPTQRHIVQGSGNQIAHWGSLSSAWRAP